MVDASVPPTPLVARVRELIRHGESIERAAHTTTTDLRKTQEAWRRAQEVAEAAFYRRLPVTLPGVLHFHATHIRPEWSKEKTQVARIGRHIFYR